MRHIPTRFIALGKYVTTTRYIPTRFIALGRRSTERLYMGYRGAEKRLELKSI
jgi:hypothetical protein